MRFAATVYLVLFLTILESERLCARKPNPVTSGRVMVASGILVPGVTVLTREKGKLDTNIVKR